ncbi:MAG: hypothetical protein OES20_13320 [Gammaproteobacteria bacterium]|nr:hypothetical protein [Gammaproteobacteria bacterium]MDH3856762.1 hypothetical protein [Gammaproteobacteria bacterium]
MSDTAHKDENPKVVLERLRKKVLGGGSLLLDSLTDEELVAMQELIFKDEAEIVSSACKPFLIAKLERTIIS